MANEWRGNPQEFPRTIALTVEDLYERLAAATCNRRLVRLMQDFNDRTTFIRRLDFHDPKRAQSTIESMLRFVDLLERGDVEAAVENLDIQLSQKLDILPRLVREGNQRAIEAVDFLNE
ncbi:FCD domain-containing protein [Pseudochelatococcus sp. B33]